jgi:hypothetical protein
MRSLLVLAAAFVAACNPYEPDLGDVPFLCHVQERTCPDGYVAVDVSETRCECHREGADDGNDENDQTPAIDGGQAQACTGDPDNDTFGSPTPTAVGGGALTFFTSTSICDATDVDYYQVELTGDHLVLEALIEMDTNLGVLDLRIDDATGGELVTATRTGDQAFARYTATTPGVYLVRVKSMSGYTSYRLDLAAK